MISIVQLQKELESGKTPSQLVEEAITRLQNSTEYNSVISDMFEIARARAKDLESSSKKGKLYGIPFIALFWGFIDGEKITWVKWLCLAIILFGVFLANLPDKKKATPIDVAE